MAEAEYEIAIALQFAREIGNPCQVWQTWVARGDLDRAQGRMQDAGEAYRAALATIEGVAGALSNASLREIFLNSDRVRSIRR